MVLSVLDGLRALGYFQEDFGIECVDGDSAGKLGPDPAAFFLRKIGRDGIWPYWDQSNEHEDIPPASGDWDQDILFDVIEVLYDHIGTPAEDKSAYYHDFAGCGWHYKTFNRPAGRATYREQMNEVLRLVDPPYEIDEAGLIVHRAPEEFQPMIDAPLPASADPTDVVGRVESAKKAFRVRGATTDDRRHAVRDLADVLELLRPQVKTVMLSKDEAAIFELANGFAIRHHRRDQRKDYEQDTWLRWGFYVYLATIHAVTRMIDRQA